MPLPILRVPQHQPLPGPTTAQRPLTTLFYLSLVPAAKVYFFRRHSLN